MGRPPLDLGTHGKIRTRQLPGGGWRAETKYRDTDGVTRPVARVDATESKATRKLRHALAERSGGGAKLSSSSRFSEAAALWIAGVERKRRATTVDRYRTRLDGKIIPRLGNLRLAECTPSTLDQYLRELEADGLKADTVRGYRTVIGGVLGLAVRLDALKANPINGVERIEGHAKPARGLTAAERVDILAKVDTDQRAIDDDLPDLLRFLLGSGVRIGEAMALRWFRVDLDAGSVEIGDALVRVRGKGLVLHEPKTKAGRRKLPLPQFVLLALTLRRPGNVDPMAPVFPNAFGGWRDPNNTSRSIRKFRDDAGYPWVTAHTFRRTAITILDQGGLTPREISGYSGHERPSMAQDSYMDRSQQSGRAATALDAGVRVARD